MIAYGDAKTQHIALSMVHEDEPVRMQLGVMRNMLNRQVSAEEQQRCRVESAKFIRDNVVMASVERVCKEAEWRMLKSKRRTDGEWLHREF